MPAIERGERCVARRRGEEARPRRRRKRPRRHRARRRRCGRRWPLAPRMRRRGSPAQACERRVDDRAVARAAAEIAGERIVDGLAAHRPRAVLVEREQAHHDAGRAEAALRAVMLDHRRLHRMERAVVGEVLDGDDLGAVDLAEQEDAGVDRLVAEPAVAAAVRAPPCRRRNRLPRSLPWCRNAADRVSDSQEAWCADENLRSRTAAHAAKSGSLLVSR